MFTLKKKGSRGGRGSRGCRGSRGGRGAATKAAPKLDFKSTKKTYSDEEDEIIALDDEDSRFNDKPSVAKPKQNSSQVITTSTSLRRNRIAYDDEDKDDDDDFDFNTRNSSKKTKLGNPITSSMPKTSTTASSTNVKKVNYQDSDEEIKSTFSIFKRVAKK